MNKQKPIQTNYVLLNCCKNTLFQVQKSCLKFSERSSRSSYSLFSHQMNENKLHTFPIFSLLFYMQSCFQRTDNGEQVKVEYTANISLRETECECGSDSTMRKLYLKRECEVEESWGLDTGGCGGGGGGDQQKRILHVDVI